jgi:hypothetical protein
MNLIQLLLICIFLQSSSSSSSDSSNDRKKEFKKVKKSFKGVHQGNSSFGEEKVSVSGEPT